MIIVTRIVFLPPDEDEDVDVEVLPSVHLTDDSALEEIAKIAGTADNWAIHELTSTGQTRQLAITGNPLRIARP
jgi:hypothetical protein